MLDSEKGISVIGMAGAAREAIEEIQRLDPDVVLMDLRMPENFDAGTTPWFLNDLFAPTLVTASSPTRAAENYGMFSSFVRYQMTAGKSEP